MEEKCAMKFPVFDEVLHDSFVLTQCGSSDMFFFYACPCYHLITWVDHKYPLPRTDASVLLGVRVGYTLSDI